MLVKNVFWTIENTSYLSLDKSVFRIIFTQPNFMFIYGYSKEQSQREGSFEHPKQMLKMIDKKKNAILLSKLLLIVDQ